MYLKWHSYCPGNLIGGCFTNMGTFPCDMGPFLWIMELPWWGIGIGFWWPGIYLQQSKLWHSVTFDVDEEAGWKQALLTWDDTEDIPALCPPVYCQTFPAPVLCPRVPCVFNLACQHFSRCHGGWSVRQGGLPHYLPLCSLVWGSGQRLSVNDSN